MFKKIRSVFFILLAAQVILGSFSYSAFAEQNSSGYSDLQNHWALYSVTQLASQGIVSGFPDGTFRPEGTVTREQFVKMLVQAVELPYVEGKGVFNDVPVDRWSNLYIETAASAGIILQEEHGTAFLPEQNISREEIALFAARALQLKANENGLFVLADKNKITESHRGLIGAAVEAGLITGFNDGTFQPLETATRAQAAVVISRVLDYKNGISPIKAATDQQELRVGLHMDPFTLNPVRAFDSVSLTIVNAMFEGLTRIGPDGQPYLAAAEKVDISEDLTTYTFTIRDHKWSNGEPVTAHDFAFAWKQVLHPEHGSEYAFLLFPLKNAEQANRGEISLDEVGVEALDNKTLKVTLEKPTPYFLQLTAAQPYFPVREKDLQQVDVLAIESGEKFANNGPFLLSKWDHEKEIELVKNPNYWDAEHVNLQRIIMPIILDEQTVVNMLQVGDLDLLTSQLYPFAPDQFGDKAITQAMSAIYWYMLNTEKPPFDNAKMRKAFAYAIDRETLLSKTMKEQVPATGIIPPSITGVERVTFTDGNTEQAKKLFAEALKEMGLSDASELPEITILYNTNDIHSDIATEIAKQWKEAFGIDVKLENTEFVNLLDRLHNGEFTVGRLGWIADYNDPTAFLELFAADSINNHTSWNNDKYNQLLEQSMKEADPAKRAGMMLEMQKIIMDEMPMIPLYFYTNSYVQSGKVKNLYMDGNGMIYFKHAYISK